MRVRKSPFESGRDEGGKHRKGPGTIGALIVCLLWTMLCDVSRADEPIFEIDIPAMNAAEALNRFAEQTGAIMLFPYDLASARQTNGVTGRYTLLQGLELLLQDTGLSGGLSDKRVVNISLRGNEQRNGMEGGDMGRKQKKGILAGAASAVLAVFGAESATGQETAEAQSTRGTPVLEEIIVTAQKRQERLQDVPISMTVLGGDELDKSTFQGITEALTRVPGVVTTEGVQGAGTQLGVRGVSAHQPLAGGASPVAYYIDGVPFGLVKGAVAPDPGAYDLERVEVLRGPQGTLYGASAMNGVVRILTEKADLDEFEFKTRGLVSGTEDGGENYRGDMAVNVPIVPSKLAARVVLGTNKLSGWIDAPNKDDVNDVQLNNVRLKLNAQPTEALSIGISGWWARSDLGAPPVSDNEGNIGALLDQPITTDYDTYNLTIAYDFPRFSVTSTTSYLEYWNEGLLDVGFLVPNFTLNTKIAAEVFTQEVYLASSGEGAWRWTLGGMYRDGEDSWSQQVDVHRREFSEAFAVFGEVTRRFLDGRLELTGGLRYFQDDASIKENTVAGGPLIQDNETFDALTPRVIVTWHPSEDLTFYGSYSEGYRSGSSQTASALFILPDLPPTEPDTLKNYELGVKGNLLDRGLAFETALYYIDWQDVQLVLNLLAPSGLGIAALVNAESASGLGFEAAVTAAPTDRLTLGVSYNWNDLTVDNDVISSGAVLFEKGARLNLSAKYTVGAFADYTFPLGAGGFEGRFSASANYHSPLVKRSLLTIDTGDPILIARTSFSINSPDHWSASLYVDNVTNENGTITGFANRPWWNLHPRPRTFGVQMDFRY